MKAFVLSSCLYLPVRVCVWGGGELLVFWGPLIPSMTFPHFGAGPGTSEAGMCDSDAQTDGACP
jgi:hypothetical protein